jgi:AraC-like DNA-binding protein
MTETWSTRTSTLTSGKAAQFGHWRELICEAFLALTPESDLRDGFTGVVTQWPLGAINLAQIDSQRQHVRRTERDIDRAPQGGYYANLQLRGTSQMAQDGRVTTLRPGDLAVVDTSAPFVFDFRTDFRQLSLFIPGPLLDAQLPGPVRTATRVDTAAGVGAAVRHALAAITRSSMTPDSAARLAVHACGMLAVALDPGLGGLGGGLEAAGDGGAGQTRSARGHACAIADIEEHLADDDLSPTATARRLGVSVRWLHALFAGHELSYTATVRRLRLEQARRNLMDPARRHLRVIDVATDAGFANVASFHRAFRREFGRTPAQLREEPARPLPGPAARR